MRLKSVLCCMKFHNGTRDIRRTKGKTQSILLITQMMTDQVIEVVIKVATIQRVSETW